MSVKRRKYPRRQQKYVREQQRFSERQGRFVTVKQVNKKVVRDEELEILDLNLMPDAATVQEEFVDIPVEALLKEALREQPVTEAVAPDEPQTEQPVSETTEQKHDDNELELIDISRKEQGEEAAKKSASKTRRILGGVLAALVLVAGIVFFWYQNTMIYKTCYVEAGIEVTVEDFLRRPDAEAHFTENSDEIDPTVPGEYHLEIKAGVFAHEATLYVQDTVAPVVEAQTVKVLYGTTCLPEDFVASITDVTKTVCSFEQMPDVTLMGQQTVKVTVTDAGNNATTVEAELVISPVNPLVSVEVGSEAIELSDIVLPGVEAELVSGLEEIDYSLLGSYVVQVNIDDVIYESEIAVVDTVAPVFEAQSLEGFTIVGKKAADFVVSEEDMTAVTYTFESAPDLALVGTQSVTIVATDEGGNESRQQVELTLQDDTEAPVFASANDFTVYIGDSISYKTKVKVKDNCEEGLEIKVDTSAVKKDVEGTYAIVYTAVDAAGNTATATVNMTIKKHMYDEEELWSMVDPILARIINDGMTGREKTWAIYQYIKGHVGYISYSEKGDWIRSACEGLMTGRGDCYVYASLSKAMLTRAGFPNVDIERIRKGDSMHFWNLVDIGDGHGWYHFDTTPRKDRPTIFLWDEATITKYSDTHNGSHNYDRSLYPVVP